MRVYSIFPSLNGEVCSAHQGSPTTFIRLAGCNLRCKWCDTKYALEPTTGTEMSVEQVVEKVCLSPFRRVTITGGEPLLQFEEFRKLVSMLNSEGIGVSVETNGSITTDYIGWRNVDSWVVDYKLPSSGEAEKMDISRYTHLGARDWIKFVVKDALDYRHMIDVLIEFFAISNFGAPGIAISPIMPDLRVDKLIKWLSLEERIVPTDVVVSLQLHKLTKFGEPD